MPTTKRETIILAALATLEGISGVSGLSVHRNRSDAVEDFPTLVLRDLGTSINREMIGFDLVTVSIDVELYVRPASSSINVGSAINELYGVVKAALLADPTLGGVAHEVREGRMTPPDFDFSDAASVQAAAVVGFELDFYATRDNPF